MYIGGGYQFIDCEMDEEKQGWNQQTHAYMFDIIA